MAYIQPSRRRPTRIGHITLAVKCAGTRSAGNPHATCDVAGAGNGLTVELVRHSQRKQGVTDRLHLRSTAPAPDPTRTPIKWVQVQGGWASAKLLLDWYGHFLPSEHHGFADALATALDGAQTAPRSYSSIFGETRRPRTQAPTRDCVAPRAGLEPATRRLTADCSTD